MRVVTANPDVYCKMRALLGVNKDDVARYAQWAARRVHVPVTHLAHLRIVLHYRPEWDWLGGFNPPNEMEFNLAYLSRKWQLRSSLVHEMTHFLQYVEGKLDVNKQWPENCKEWAGYLLRDDNEFEALHNEVKHVPQARRWWGDILEEAEALKRCDYVK